MVQLLIEHAMPATSALQAAILHQHVLNQLIQSVYNVLLVNIPAQVQLLVRHVLLGPLVLQGLLHALRVLPVIGQCRGQHAVLVPPVWLAHPINLPVAPARPTGSALLALYVLQGVPIR